jgi:hypothetical protein
MPTIEEVVEDMPAEETAGPRVEIGGDADEDGENAMFLKQSEEVKKIRAQKEVERQNAKSWMPSHRGQFVAKPLDVLEPGGSVAPFTAYRPPADIVEEIDPGTGEEDGDEESSSASATEKAAPKRKTWKMESPSEGMPDAEFVRAKDKADIPKATRKIHRPLTVFTHFMPDGGEDVAMSLKVKLPYSWDDRTVAEAVVQPFVEAYDKAHPDRKVSTQGPFTRLRLLIWGGPTWCPSDHFRKADRDGADEVAIAERSLSCLFDATEPVSMLRSRAPNPLKPSVEVELIKAESTAIVVRTFPSTALLAPGERLMGMLNNTSTDPEEMHALVDAATAGGELAYLGLTTARDRDGRNCLMHAVTRGDTTLCRKLLRRREVSAHLASTQPHQMTL